MLIGICGGKRQGKDTIATILEEYDYKRIAFADPLKEIAHSLWGLSFDQLYGTEEQKETIDPRWGVSPRHLMQVLGTEVVRNAHADTWVRRTMSLIQEAEAGLPIRLPNFTTRAFETKQWPHSAGWSIPDVRFLNEAMAIKSKGGLIIKVIRSGTDIHDNHASEQGLPVEVIDYVIDNDGSIDDLRVKVRSLHVWRG